MSKTLKKCPFCGGAAYLELEGNIARLYANHNEQCIFGRQDVIASVESQDDDAADLLASKWNMRASDVTPEGCAVVPLEPTLGMVMAGEEAFESQMFTRLDFVGQQVWPSEALAELGARVAYRSMLAALQQEKNISDTNEEASNESR